MRGCPAVRSEGRDLNRDFPDRFASSALEPTGSEQPETKAIMDWTLATGFVAGASMHEARRPGTAVFVRLRMAEAERTLVGCLQGALVANYPWDGTSDRSTRYEACPDDAIFRHLATLYATTHKRMSAPDNSVRLLDGVWGACCRRRRVR